MWSPSVVLTPDVFIFRPLGGLNFLTDGILSESGGRLVETITPFSMLGSGIIGAPTPPSFTRYPLAVERYLFGELFPTN